MKRWPTIAICTAVIWFSVSVPVLSELIADVEPSVSTERSRFTMAPALASVDVPGGEDGRHDGGQAGRDRGNRERHGGQEHDVERLVAVEAEPDRDRQRDARDQEDLVRQAVELLGERRLLGDLRREHVGDVADLGRHAGGRDDERSPHHGSPGCS